MKTHFCYDAFLCHSSKDKALIKDLAVRLKADGVSIWFDSWQIKPGDSIPRKIEDGLQNSKILLFFISHHSTESEWATLEVFTRIMQSTSDRDRRLIPVRLDTSDPPAIISQFAWVDWTDQSEHEYARLLEACIRRSNEPVLAS